MLAVRPELLDWIEQNVAQVRPVADIIDREPGFTIDDAYRLQFALMARKVEQGERIIGYKAAHTSLAIQQEQGRALTVGTLLDTRGSKESDSIVLNPQVPTFAEPELAVLLKRDLQGPGVTMFDAYRAVEGVLPAIEVVTPARGERKRSAQMSIAQAKSEGTYVLGDTVTSLSGINLRLEGVVASVNGVPQRSGAGVEAMGHPLNVVIAVTELLSRFDMGLKAGMVLLTGSVTNNIAVSPGDEMCVETTRFGRVTARFAR
jgi:2-keto-4-pentenoate hydratase